MDVLVSVNEIIKNIFLFFGYKSKKQVPTAKPRL